jgi:hypothetical protein
MLLVSIAAHRSSSRLMALDLGLPERAEEDAAGLYRRPSLLLAANPWKQRRTAGARVRVGERRLS